jgi:hypothetical protein
MTMIMLSHPRHPRPPLPRPAKSPQTGPGSVYSACPKPPDRRTPRSQKLQRDKQRMRGDISWLRRGRDEPLRKERGR